MRPTFDQRDAEIVRDRAAMLDSHDPVVGDFVRFPNEIERRVSYVWKEAEGFPTAVQTSDRWGSFYLGHGYVSFSGGPGTTHRLRATGLLRGGRGRVDSDLDGQCYTGLSWECAHDTSPGRPGVALKVRNHGTQLDQTGATNDKDHREKRDSAGSPRNTDASAGGKG